SKFPLHFASGHRFKPHDIGLDRPLARSDQGNLHLHGCGSIILDSYLGPRGVARLEQHLVRVEAAPAWIESKVDIRIGNQIMEMLRLKPHLLLGCQQFLTVGNEWATVPGRYEV